MTIEPSPNLRLRVRATAWTTAVAFVLLGASTLLILSGLLGQSGGGPFDLIQNRLVDVARGWRCRLPAQPALSTALGDDRFLNPA